MAKTTQRGRLMAFTTPLGADSLLLEKLEGSEALSELFEFELALLAEPGTPIAFENVLGRPASIAFALPDGTSRPIHGIVSRFSQGAEIRGPQGDVTYIRYRATLVPKLWLLTRRSRIRIFQHKVIPAILREVLSEFEVKYDLRGQYEPRDYCVQYRETDFAFISRLMEEEGIYYYFQHTKTGHTLVVSDHTNGHATVPGASKIAYEPRGGMFRGDDRISDWEKTQEVRTGRHTFWDNTFELPGHNLEAKTLLQDSVNIGTVTHKIRLNISDALEAYDFPGGYAQRFDGVDPGGGDRTADIEKVFKDNSRTATIRAAQEAVQGIRIVAEGTCRQLVAGHKFSLNSHFNANGDYIVTRLTHKADLSDAYLMGSRADFGIDEPYTNTFECIPTALPFRPTMTTPKPTIAGTQTATVVGPAGEEIFTDKYGRVKVQFPWDREGKMDADSSCWVRVSQAHAGKSFGGIDIPRMGQELIIAFEEGDPDRPIAVGRVYNAAAMPPFGLPGTRMISGLKSNTYPGGGGSNELSMDDTKGKERMYLHAQFNQDEVVENNQTSHVKLNRTKTVDVDETTTIGNNRTEKVAVNEKVEVGSNHDHTVGANHTEKVGANMSLTVGAMKNEMVVASSTETVGVAKAITVGGAMAITVGGAMNVAVGLVAAEEVGLTKTIVVGEKFEIVCGAAKLTMEASGKITIDGNPVVINGGALVDVNAGLIDLN